ncbi:hypothetical protein BJX64DRAFT_299742 [Aspergillus heterothallicus]
MHNYCTICAVGIRQAPETGPKDLKWHQKVRAVHVPYNETDAAWRPAGPVTLTGIGYLDSNERLVAPSDPESSFEVNGARLNTLYPFYDPAAKAFIFHAACWNLLLERVPEAQSDIGRCATIFFYMVFCTTWDLERPFLRPGHDFGGVSQFQDVSREDSIEDMIDQGFGSLLGDPSQFNDMAEILSSMPPGPSRPCLETRTNALKRPFLSHDALSLLPVEILIRILSMLTSVGVQHVRLASRRIASMTHPASLPQSFWRSRYSPDFEMGFASPVNSSGNQDWRNAYFTLKHALRDSNNCGANAMRAKSRERIWALVKINATLVAQWKDRVALHGDRCIGKVLPVSSTTSSTSDFSGAMIGGCVLEDCHELLRVGGRKLHDRTIVLPLDKFAVRTVRVSTVSFNLQTFISGLEFDLVGRSSDTRTTLTLGYSLSASTTCLRIGPDVDILGLELAVAACGVTGIRVLVEGSEPGWFGDAGSGRVEIALGKLSFNTLAAQQINFTASFDPVLNLDFGGPSGERLAFLTRIVIHILETAPIVGFTFYYLGDDHSPLHFGRHGPMQVSLLIDGPGGEFISSVVVEKTTDDGRVDILRMRTNLGNELVTGRNELWGREGPHAPRNDQEAQIRCGSPIMITTDMLKPPKGQQITGFTAALEPEHGSFSGFGLQCEEIPASFGGRGGSASPQHPLSVAARLASSLGSHVIADGFHFCNAYTWASLKSVRSVRFSGRRPEGRSRFHGEVSGMWFEYYGSRPMIVGQWLSEAESMDLEREEEITRIVIWLSNIQCKWNQRFDTGRVVRISLFTSFGRTFSYPDENPSTLTENHTILRYQQNYLEHLSALVWAFNTQFDFPRVLTSPGMPDTKLYCWDPDRYLVRWPWVYPQRALWARTTSTDRLGSITGYIHRLDSDNHGITGLSFTYSSGTVDDIGSVNPHDALEPVQFHPDDDIQRVTVYRAAREIVQITFFCHRRSDGAENELIIGDIPRYNSGTPITARRLSTDDTDIARRKYTAWDGQDPPWDKGDLPKLQVVGLWLYPLAGGTFAIGFMLLDEGIAKLGHNYEDIPDAEEELCTAYGDRLNYAWGGST